MQGFNRYYPPDYDPSKHQTLNDYHGKHALGDRARKIDQGILITRFELPFNIWCGTCNAHIGMGVRYNAEKRKIGMYYSTPIFAFRCKCHLCSGWFEIRTDPKNTRYVVESGARQKNEEWDPVENGGFAVHETDPTKAGDVDPLAQLEKTAQQQKDAREVGAPRLDSLQDLSEHYNADPFEQSKRVRRIFRTEKKIEKEKRAADDAVREKFSLPADLKLVDKAEVETEASHSWKEQRREFEVEDQARQRRLAAEGGLSTALKAKAKPKPTPSSLASQLLRNSAKRAEVSSSIKAGQRTSLSGIVRKIPLGAFQYQRGVAPKGMTIPNGSQIHSTRPYLNED